MLGDGVGGFLDHPEGLQVIRRDVEQMVIIAEMGHAFRQQDDEVAIVMDVDGGYLYPFGKDRLVGVGGKAEDVPLAKGNILEKQEFTHEVGSPGYVLWLGRVGKMLCGN